MTFVGDLGDGVIFLTSRVRLIDPNESFYTHANHRIRDSHVGRSGHWIDIVVHGPCSDDELELIRRLAQEVDNRPVMVRRAAAKKNALPREPSRPRRTTFGSTAACGGSQRQYET